MSSLYVLVSPFWTGQRIPLSQAFGSSMGRGIGSPDTIPYTTVLTLLVSEPREEMWNEIVLKCE